MTTAGEVSAVPGKSGEFTWTIPVMTSVEFWYKKISSPTFFFGGTFWCFGIKIDIIAPDNSTEFINIHFQKISVSPPVNLEVFFRLKILNDKRDLILVDAGSLRKTDVQEFSSRKVISKKKCKLLFSNAVTLVCCLRLKEDSIDSCNAAITKCWYCNNILHAHENISSHLRKCEGLVIKCRNCNKDVALKKWYGHKCQMTETMGTNSTDETKCSYCKKSLNPSEDISSHLQKCEDLPINCRKCGSAVAVRDWYGHPCLITGEKGLVGATATCCSFCKIKLSSIEDVFSHLQECDYILRKCRACGNIVALKDWYEHICNISYVPETQCPFCKITLVEDISSHLQKCMDIPIQCRTCGDAVASKNWYDPKYIMTGTKGEPTGVFPEKKLLHNFKELFMRKEDCDVVIRVKGQEFPAHKIILKVRSPVLASTLRSDMKEKSTGIVDIGDCDPSCFSDFLGFLYFADPGSLSKESVFNLFTVADKYDVQDLRKMCVEFMKKSLSVDTFCDTITLAILHSDAELIQLTTDFFTKNAPKIILTAKWQSFLAENPTQGNELLIKLLVPN